jgi:hypothetical protein
MDNLDMVIQQNAETNSLLEHILVSTNKKTDELVGLLKKIEDKKIEVEKVDIKELVDTNNLLKKVLEDLQKPCEIKLTLQLK